MGPLSDSDDCNTLEQGVYTYTTTAPQNAPSGTQYGTLVVIQGASGGNQVYNLQLLSTSNRGFYYRRKHGNVGDAFAAWTKVTGTQV